MKMCTIHWLHKRNKQHSNRQLDDVVPMHNLIEYSNNYLETSGRLLQYYSNDPNDNIRESVDQANLNLL